MLQHGDGRAVSVPVRKALFELGRVILAQQINPLTQKTPIGEAEHCLSNYRGSLQNLDGLNKNNGGLSFYDPEHNESLYRVCRFASAYGLEIVGKAKLG